MTTMHLYIRGATEICGDGIDQDCNGSDLSCDVDADGDGFSVAQGDCDDSDPNKFPGQIWYADCDADGYYSVTGSVSCDVPSGASSGCADLTVPDGGYSHTSGGDCNDEDPSIYPGAPEVCDNKDNDCDGLYDEELIAPQNPNQQGVCAGSIQICIDGVWYDDYSSILNYEEVEVSCDGIDNDCDGQVDEGCDDADGDGVTVAQGDCNDNDPTIYPGAPEIIGDGIDQNCDLCDQCYVDLDNDGIGGSSTTQDDDLDCDNESIPNTSSVTGDCNDGNATVYPGATEIVGDGVDQNCDGCDDCWRDMDSDGYGSGVVVSDNNLDCNDGTTANTTSVFGDCDDSNAAVNPGVPEVCGDGIDNNCQGGIDEGCETDADGDGFTIAQGDCDDTDDTVYPGAQELIDGKLNDCNGSLSIEEVDNDGDGYVSGTIDPGGWDGDPGIVGGDDCADYNVNIHPGAVEVCDGFDTDCSGTIDASEIDNDGDGYIECSGYVENGSGLSGGDDCDDADISIYPGAPEICGDGIDQDCNGSDLTCEVGVDADADGYDSEGNRRY